MASFEDLKRKYNPVFVKGNEIGLRVENLQMEGDKLLIRGVVPSDFAKTRLWDEIKRVDASVVDLTADINVKSGEVYTVKSGDTLSQIAQRFYGDTKAYQKIFEANRDKLTSPDRIQVGQELRLP
jgi:nucleoid-associated protein YgaU